MLQKTTFKSILLISLTCYLVTPAYAAGCGGQEVRQSAVAMAAFVLRFLQSIAQYWTAPTGPVEISTEAVRNVREAALRVIEGSQQPSGDAIETQTPRSTTIRQGGATHTRKLAQQAIDQRNKQKEDAEQKKREAQARETQLQQGIRLLFGKDALVDTEVTEASEGEGFWGVNFEDFLKQIQNNPLLTELLNNFITAYHKERIQGNREHNRELANRLRAKFKTDTSWDEIQKAASLYEDENTATARKNQATLTTLRNALNGMPENHPLRANVLGLIQQLENPNVDNQPTRAELTRMIEELQPRQ